MKTFIVTLRTAGGRQQINVIAATSIDALLSVTERFHGQTIAATARQQGGAQ